MTAVALDDAPSHIIRPNVPYEDYARLEGVRISSLKELGRSPLHFQHAKAFPKRSAPLTLGSAAHVAILEPERFERDHARWGEKTAAGKLRPRTGKDYESFAAEHEGRTILTADQYDNALAMQAAIRGCSIAMHYLRAGSPEVSMQWIDAETRTPMKGRVDWLTNDGWPALVGLKTTRDCRPFVFGKQAATLSYHLTWAAYVDGHKAITGTAPKAIEIVVESAPPHDVAVYLIPSEVIEQGRLEYRDLLAKLRECEATGDWHGAVPDERRLGLPAWAYEQDEDEDVDGIEGIEMRREEIDTDE